MNNNTAKLKPGQLIMVSYGNLGVQLAMVKRVMRTGNILAWKWKGNSGKWTTKPTTVRPHEWLPDQPLPTNNFLSKLPPPPVTP